MDTRQLRAFCAVVERKSFSQAAERLGVTQPAVSLQIRSLEKRLGRQLLDRSGPPRRADRGRARALPRRAADAALEEQLVEELDGGRRRRARRHARDRRLDRPGRHRRPASCSASSSASTPASHVSLSISDTQTRRRARRRARARARRRRRGARATAASSSSRSSATRSCSPCPPGHRFAGRTVTLDELREEPLIVMQEGAGVRQVIEDELRSAGTRLRDLEPRLELGLQESVKAAVVAGYGVTFISRAAIEADLAAGTLADGARRRARPVARDLARPRGRPRADARRRGVRRRSRGSGCDRPLGARRARRACSPSSGSSARSSSRASAGPSSSFPRRGALDGGAVRPDRRRRRGRRGRRRPARGRRRQRDRPRRRRSRPRPACRSSRCRRRTRAPSGRRSSASAIPTAG